MVYLIGAGCGNYDLITLRGLDRLKRAQTIVYDSLIDRKLLDFVAPDAEKICVGKRAGKPSETQENINGILVKNALDGKTVARLKGGDPFVFGRGGEEIIALSEHNIPFEVIPGISSSIAVPELAGIPVTHRSVSRSFHVITGHTREDRLPAEMEMYARLGGTLVFLMGLGHIKSIADSLMEYGKAPQTPAAVISNGGTGSQRVVRGTLFNISEKCVENSMKSPAVIVVGETAGYDFCGQRGNELDGVTVTVTGTRSFSDRLAAQFESCGASVSRAGIMRIEPLDDSTELEKVFAEISDYTMIVLTSPNGAELFIQSLHRFRTDIRRLSHIKFAVIGNATAGVLERHGIYPDIVPDSFTSEELGRAIADSAQGTENVLILRAVQGTSQLTDILSCAGISYKEIRIYDVTGDEKAVPVRADTDFIVFASCSGVRDFFRRGNSISPETRAVCIGYATAAELKRLCCINAALPKLQNAESIVGLIKEMKGHQREQLRYKGD